MAVLSLTPEFGQICQRDNSFNAPVLTSGTPEGGVFGPDHDSGMAERSVFYNRIDSLSPMVNESQQGLLECVALTGLLRKSILPLTCGHCPRTTWLVLASEVDT